VTATSDSGACSLCFFFGSPQRMWFNTSMKLVLGPETIREAEHGEQNVTATATSGLGIAGSFVCKQCGAHVPAPPDLTANEVACPYCGTRQLVPNLELRSALAMQQTMQHTVDRVVREFSPWRILLKVVVFAALIVGVWWARHAFFSHP
jgi:DNA-directed RNA polymerase subunit RPC12/RpoP